MDDWFYQLTRLTIDKKDELEKFDKIYERQKRDELLKQQEKLTAQLKEMSIHLSRRGY